MGVHCRVHGIVRYGLYNRRLWGAGVPVRISIGLALTASHAVFEESLQHSNLLRGPVTRSPSVHKLTMLLSTSPSEDVTCFCIEKNIRPITQ